MYIYGKKIIDKKTIQIKKLTDGFNQKNVCS